MKVAAAARAIRLARPKGYIRTVVVPTSEPKTKPKACNYGLLHARGALGRDEDVIVRRVLCRKLHHVSANPDRRGV